MQAIRYNMDKEQGPTESHRKLIKYLVINQNGKKYKKEYIYIYICVYIYIYMSHICNAAEMNTIVNQVNFNKIFKNSHILATTGHTLGLP